jgi:hypothetical protein
VSWGKVWLVVHGLPKAGHGFLQPALFCQSDPKIAMGLGNAGIKAEGRPKAVDRDFASARLIML